MFTYFLTELSLLSFILFFLSSFIFFKFSKNFLWNLFIYYNCFHIIYFIIHLNFFEENSYILFLNSFYCLTLGIYELKLIFLLYNFYFFFNIALTNFKKNYFEFLSIQLILYIFSFCTIIQSNNFLVWFICIEIQNFINYFLISITNTKQINLRSIFIYLILNSLISIFFFIILIAFYFFFKTLIFSDIILLNIFYFKINFSLYYLIIILFFFNLCIFKLAGAPFHFWIKEIYKGISFSILGFLTLNTKLVFIFILNNFLLIFSNSYSYLSIQSFLIFSGILSLIFGNILTLNQKTIKTLLICSTIVHVGYLLLSLIQYFNIFSISSIWSYLFHYILNLMFIWIIFTYFFEFHFLTDFYLVDLIFYFNYLPFLNLIFCFSLLSIGGLPPLIGFLFKYQILISIFYSTNLQYLIMSLFLSLISCYYYLIIIKLTFFEKILNYTIFWKSIIFFYNNQFLILLIIFINLVYSPFFFSILYNWVFTFCILLFEI